MEVEKNNSAEVSAIVQDFILGKDTLINIFKKRIFQYFKKEPYFINTDMVNDPIVFENIKTKSSITMEDFFEILVGRWIAEINYLSEISKLKDLIDSYFHKYCSEIANKIVSAFFRKMEEYILEELIIGIQFERRQIATEFCLSVMNGFDNDLRINHFNLMVKNVLTPFRSPFPVNLVSNLEKVLHKLQREEMLRKIEDCFKNLIHTIKEDLKLIEISFKDFKNINFQSFKLERRLCKLVLNYETDKIHDNAMLFSENGQRFIEELKIIVDPINVEKFTTYFISNIGVILKMNILLIEIQISKENSALIIDAIKNEITAIKGNAVIMKMMSQILNACPFFLNSIIVHTPETKKVIYNDFLNKSFSNLENITRIVLDFQEGTSEVTDGGIIDFSRSLSKMKDLKDLRLIFKGGFNAITNNGMKSLANSLENCEQLELLHLNFSFGNSNITDVGITEISRAICKMKSLHEICLDFQYRKNITDTGLADLSTSIQHLYKIRKISLNFSYDSNKITDVGLNALSNSIKDMDLLQELTLEFSRGYNEITDNGLKNLSEALHRNTALTHLHIDFSSGNNKVGGKGLNYLFSGLKNMLLIKFIYLNFEGKNEISDEGMKTLSTSFEKLLFLEQLHLIFWGGNSKITDEGFGLLMEAIQHMESLDKLRLNFSESGNSISDKGISIFASTLLNFKVLGELHITLKGEGHHITDKGISFVAEALPALTRLTTIYFNFEGKNNSISDFMANKIRKLNTHEKMKISVNINGYEEEKSNNSNQPHKPSYVAQPHQPRNVAQPQQPKQVAQPQQVVHNTEAENNSKKNCFIF